VAALVFAASVVLLVKVGWLRNSDAWVMPWPQSARISYVEAVLVAANLFCAAALEDFFRVLLSPLNALVRWLGELTFPLYLCHRPLLYFLGALSLGERGTLIQNLWLAAGTLCVVAAISILGNRLRRQIRLALA
jgi:peptidoglycan/LPS O-acetylase OafA/YrhL